MRFNRGEQYICSKESISIFSFCISATKAIRLKTWRMPSFLIFIVLLMVLAACGDSNGENSSSADDKNDKEIVMGQISRAENIATTNMWKVILEEKGYDVEFNLLDMGTIMAALESGELDVTLEVWLSVQDANYLKQYEDSVDFAEEPWYDNARGGLVVPEYMDEVNSIEDLKKYQDKFEGERV